MRAPFYSRKPCDELARRVTGRVATIPTDVGATPEIETFFDLFDTIVGTLAGELEATAAGG